MPLFKHINLPNGVQIAIWEVTETIEVLALQLGNDIEEPSKSNFKKTEHHLQWYASRLLLKHVFNAKKILLQKDEFNKPSLFVNDNAYHISISHAGKFAAIIVSNNVEVGIDIEKIDERILKISHKFLNEQEIELLKKPLNPIELEITKIWSAKETLYKVHGKKSLDFKKNLFIKNLNKPLKGAILTNEFSIEIDIDCILIDQFILTYATRS
jgi:4'-phosphopantetheinyl transferase